MAVVYETGRPLLVQRQLAHPRRGRDQVLGRRCSAVDIENPASLGNKSRHLGNLRRKETNTPAVRGELCSLEDLTAVEAGMAMPRKLTKADRKIAKSQTSESTFVRGTLTRG